MKINIILIILFSVILISSELSAQKAMWAKSIGGNVDDFARSIITDKDKNIYIAGFSGSTVVKFGDDYSHTNSGSWDSFIAKYNSEGQFQRVEYVLGGQILQVVMDSSENFYICGNINTDTMFFNNGISLVNYNKFYRDAYIAKYDKNWQCQWAKSMSGDNTDNVYSISVDDFGNVFTGGNFVSSNLYFSDNIKLKRIDNFTPFIAKYDNSGNCLWAKIIFKSSINDVISLLINKNNELIVAGNRQNDGFITKYDQEGKAIWWKLISGEKNDFIRTMVFDNYENIYVGGDFESVELLFDGTLGLKGNPFRMSGADGFWAKFDNDGNYIKSERITGSSFQSIKSISFDNDNNLYYCGLTDSPILYFSKSIQLTKNGRVNSFFAKYVGDSSCHWVERIGSSLRDYSNCIKFYTEDNFLILGEFETVNLDFNNNIKLKNSTLNTSLVYRDIFLVNYDKTFVSKSKILTDIHLYNEHKVNEYSISAMPKISFKNNFYDDEQIDFHYRISPNPARDFIEISLDRWTPPSRWSPSDIVQIFNTLGIEVGQSSLIDGKNRIDISNLPTGVYFIKISGSNGACSIVEKFVKI